MLGISTGRYKIIRGIDSVNEFGDTVPSQEVVREGVLGSVIERARQDFNPNGERIGTYRELVGRFGFGTDIRDSDRIQDEKTGEVFIVNSVRRTSSILGKPDLVLDLSHS